MCKAHNAKAPVAPAPHPVVSCASGAERLRAREFSDIDPLTRRAVRRYRYAAAAENLAVPAGWPRPSPASAELCWLAGAALAEAREGYPARCSRTAPASREAK